MLAGECARAPRPGLCQAAARTWRHGWFRPAPLRRGHLRTWSNHQDEGRGHVRHGGNGDARVTRLGKRARPASHPLPSGQANDGGCVQRATTAHGGHHGHDYVSWEWVGDDVEERHGNAWVGLHGHPGRRCVGGPGWDLGGGSGHVAVGVGPRLLHVAGHEGGHPCPRALLALVGWEGGRHTTSRRQGPPTCPCCTHARPFLPSGQVASAG